ncbi:MAG TPA: Na/Pi symporter, partial [Phycisphaerae bacterium]|nr:Na/Pi symporter [Phycisphaerae bacterium]
TGLHLAATDPAGEKFLKWIFGLVSDPFTGLFVGLLVTSIVQSSSFTTSMTVGLVATGDVTLVAAIPIIMGANIGTSVTALIVSLAHMGRREEFRRSFSAALLHDNFNMLSVLLFFPLEYKFHIISTPVLWIAKNLAKMKMFDSDPTKQIGIFKHIFNVVGDFGKWLMTDVLHMDAKIGGCVLAALAIVLLFAALGYLVKILRSVMMDRLSGAFNKTIFRNQPIAFIFGLIATATIQSSSVTTSLVVPLVAAGVLQHAQIFPYMMGANIGTTATAMMAAIGMGSPVAIACACAHLLFNLYGTAVFWPLQMIPINISKFIALKASRNRAIAIIFVVGMYFVLPVAALTLMKMHGK